MITYILIQKGNYEQKYSKLSKFINYYKTRAFFNLYLDQSFLVFSFFSYIGCILFLTCLLKNKKKKLK